MAVSRRRPHQRRSVRRRARRRPRDPEPEDRLREDLMGHVPGSPYRAPFVSINDGCEQFSAALVAGCVRSRGFRARRARSARLRPSINVLRAQRGRPRSARASPPRRFDATRPALPDAFRHARHRSGGAGMAFAVAHAACRGARHRFHRAAVVPAQCPCRSLAARWPLEPLELRGTAALWLRARTRSVRGSPYPARGSPHRAR